MNKLSLIWLVALAALVTGCPHNEYVVELTPRGNAVERSLAFYRTEESFPSNELAVISALYPPGGVAREGERHTAKGEFAGTMPGDVGGAGYYKNFPTSLGGAGYYVERFRGNDDLTGQTTQRLAAAEQLADLVLGWSRAEFGREPAYKNLRHFLDVDFRRDLKNLALYSWAGEMASSYKDEAAEEFIVRFGQYLVERGYVKIEDAPGLIRSFFGKSDAQALLPIQRLVAEKLGVPPAGPMPTSLDFLADGEALEKSFDKFLAGTTVYRVRLRQWEKEKKLKPDLQKPNPSDAVNELFARLIPAGPGGEDDKLTVKLALPSAPTHTNGKWDETLRQIVWESRLESRGAAARLPVFCYASWSHPNDEFQSQHFGRVILGGDELLKYCLWRSGLAEAQGDEWDKFLSGLRPGEEWTMKLEAFQFAGDTPKQSREADLGKELIKTALQPKP